MIYGKKWRLSTGKIVEDALYEFSKQCLVDHPACSMILDLQDKNYLKEGVFTEAEMEEMKMKNPNHFITPIPKGLADYINVFNLTNFKDLRAELLKVQDWEPDYGIDKYHN